MSDGCQGQGSQHACQEAFPRVHLMETGIPSQRKAGPALRCGNAKRQLHAATRLQSLCL